MKYIVVLGDGMADLPIDEFSGQTPMEAAEKPYMNYLAAHGTCGMAKTVPDDLPAGSDTANLSVMGYNPHKYYSGRSPLEAASMGIDLKLSDVTYRCNLVTLSEEKNLVDATMVDYSAGEITTAEAKELIEYMNDILHDETRELYPGVSYRHCLVVHDIKTGVTATPPHDITDKPVKDYLPHEGYGAELLKMMEKSYELLKDHPVNKARVAKGLNPANCLWFWGEGTKPALTAFKDLYNVDGAVISAVDLLKGIGICAGLEAPEIEGATGNINTNYENKVAKALEVLKDKDFVYVHIEAPDECGHQRNALEKKRAVELLDARIVKPIFEAMKQSGEEFSIMVAPDHPTPVSIGTHTHEPVPYIIYRSAEDGQAPIANYCEREATAKGIYVAEGYTLMSKFLQK